MESCKKASLTLEELIHKNKDLFFIVYIVIIVSDKSNLDESIFFIFTIKIYLIPSPNITLIIADIFCIFHRKNTIQKRSQYCHEFLKIECKIFFVIGNTHIITHDTSRSQVFFFYDFSDEFVTRYSKEFSRIFPIFILSDESYTEHADKNNLSLNSTNAYRQSDRIVWCDEEKSNHRKYKILEGDNNSPCSYRKKTQINIGIDDKNNNQYTHESEDTNEINHLNLAIIFEIVFRVFRINTRIIPRKDMILGLSLCDPCNELYEECYDNQDNREAMIGDRILNARDNIGKMRVHVYKKRYENTNGVFLFFQNIHKCL